MKKIISLIIIGIILLSVLSVSGELIKKKQTVHSENGHPISPEDVIYNGPEITDENQDVIGPLGRTLQSQFFSKIDISNVWFSEDASQPEYLFISIQLKNLKRSFFFTAMYNVNWNYSNASYGVVFLNKAAGISDVAIVMNLTSNYSYPIHATFDAKENNITFEVYKDDIGGPQIGETLTDTYSLSIFGLIFPAIGVAFVAGDMAPNQGFGSNYEIKY